MHFGKQLKLLAYEPWKEQHLDYAMLKRVLADMMTRARAEGRVVLVSKSALEKQRKSQETDYDVLRESFRSPQRYSGGGGEELNVHVSTRRIPQAGLVKRYVATGLLEKADDDDDEDDDDSSEYGATATTTTSTTSTTATETATTSSTTTTTSGTSAGQQESQIKLNTRLDGLERAKLNMDNLSVVLVDTDGKPKASPMILTSSSAEDDRGMSFYGDLSTFVGSSSGDGLRRKKFEENFGVNPGDEMTPLISASRRRKRKELKKPHLAPGSVQIQMSEEEKMYKEPVRDDSEEMMLMTQELLSMITNPFEREVDRVGAFFRSTYDELVDELGQLMITVQERKSLKQSCISLKNEFLQLRVEAEELLDYSRLNLLGFTKIVKKFIRHSNFMGRGDFLNVIQQSDFVVMLPWAEDLADSISEAILRVYARDSSERVKYTQEIKTHMSTERAWKMSSLLYKVDEHKRQVKAKPPPKIIVKPIPLAVAACVYILLTFIPIFPDDKKPAQRCLALLVMCMIMWVSECVPLFLTAITGALFTALSYVLLDENGNEISITESISAVMTRLYPDNVPLVLAGFSISAAFKRYKIDLLVANWILGRKFFQTPRRFVIAVELLCFFMSAWVTNIAGSVLTLTVIMPIIRDLPDRCRYIKTLLMATAMSGSFGGVSTQIASPQNAVTVALGEYSIGFLEFIAIGAPIWPVLLFTEHLIIMYYLPPDVEKLPEINSDTIMQDAGLSSTGYATASLETSRRVAHTQKKAPINEKFPWQMFAALAVTFISIILWICSNWLEIFGKDMGLISMVPLLLFYGTGLLGTEDFEKMPWTLIMLLAGGNVLGYAVDSSKLLSMLAEVITMLPQNLFLIVVVCNIIMLVASTFVSSTVSAIILLPLALQVGISVGHPKAIVMCCVIMCSGAMSLPVSSFPNMNAISVTDPNGGPYLTTIDFIKCGITQTIFAYVFSCLIPLGMSLLFGF